MTTRFRRRPVPDIWPGFVDAISTLLIIIIFLLMLFTLAQYFLSQILSGRDEALDRLNRQVAELADMLSLERESNSQLRDEIALLSGELQSSTAAKDRLSARLSALGEERDQLRALLETRTEERDRLRAAVAEGEARADKVEKELEDAYKTIQADREKIEVQLATLESLRRDVAALRKVREELEGRVTQLAASLDQSRAALKENRETLAETRGSLAETRETLSAREEALTAARDRSKALEARLSTEQERTALAQKQIEETALRLENLRASRAEVEEALESEKKLSAKAQARVDLLNRQIAAMRQQLARLAAALEASEAESEEQRVRIVNLGQRLNAALASKVEELARYRSEFFGRLREALGDVEGVRIEGDRFVFQSEVLFPSASGDLTPKGQGQIKRLADTLKEVAGRIPSELDWILRVDGHTDKLPIRTEQFPSNWELSAARAISVVKYLIALGLPPERLAATGFGQYRPIDTSDSPEALRRNRRIEFKLTNR